MFIHLPSTKSSATLLALSVWLSSSLAFAQTPATTVSGRVFDAQTNQPLPFATVYLNNSTRGTTADENGFYRIPNIPLGDQELVGSMLGYQTLKTPLRLTSVNTRTTDLRLEPTGNALDAVTVIARRSKSWERELRQFSRELLGNQPLARKCQLMNPNALLFQQEKGHLVAQASEPLVIENNALGYRIHYDLLRFDFYKNKLLFAGTARFEELKPTSARQLSQWQTNRLKAYRGSLRHVLASLIDGTHEAEGFTVYFSPLQADDRMGDGKAMPLVRVNERKLITESMAPALFARGELPFERRLQTKQPIEVYYNRVYARNSPYRDSPYAYSILLLPNESFNLTTNGQITQGNGLDVRGYLGNDRLGTMLPADWEPTDKQPIAPTDIMAGRPLRPDAGLDSLQRDHQRHTKHRPPLVFVHTDKAFYSTGDVVWLSAYVLAHDTQLPVKNGFINTLGVDLLAPNGQLVHHQWLRLTDGRSASGFRLSDTLVAGTYRLRVYTSADQVASGPGFECPLTVYNVRLPASTSQPEPMNASVGPASRPEITPENWTLKAVLDSAALIVSVQVPEKHRDQPVYITLQSREQIVYRQRWQLTKGEARFRLPIASLPPGVCQLTLWDTTRQARAERLVFMPERTGTMQVQILISKPRYQSRETVGLGLRFLDAEGFPVGAIWSAAVTDADQQSPDTARSDIRTFLLLTKGLRGPIQSPNDYLKPDHLADLDTLLLTQQWRQLPTPQPADTTGGWTLSGQVRDAKGQAVVGKSVLLVLEQKGQKMMFSPKTNAQGAFRVAGLFATDTVQVRTRVLEVDPADALITFDKPGTQFATPPMPPPNWAVLKNWQSQVTTRQEAWPALYRDANARQLDEVVVKATKYRATLTQIERPIEVQRASLHGEADGTLVVEGNNSTLSAGTIWSLIGMVPGYRLLQRGYLPGDNTPLYIIDGMYADVGVVDQLDPRIVSRIEILKNATTAGMYGSRGASGVIAIFTLKGKGVDLAPVKSTVTTIYGYTSPREFYVPRYDSPEADGRVDRRDVLFWQPLGQSESDGLGNLSFPLSDTARRLQVVIQGITTEGIPISFTWILPVR